MTETLNLSWVQVQKGFKNSWAKDTQQQKQQQS